MNQQTKGFCSVCGQALTGGSPCWGGVKVEVKANAATDDGIALQRRDVAGCTGESIHQASEVAELEGRLASAERGEEGDE